MSNTAESRGWGSQGPRAQYHGALEYLTLQPGVAHSPNARGVVSDAHELLAVVRGEAEGGEDSRVVMATRLYDFWKALDAHARGIFRLRLKLGDDGTVSFGFNPSTGQAWAPEQNTMRPMDITDEQDEHPDEVAFVASAADRVLPDGSMVSMSLFQSVGRPNEFCIAMATTYAHPIQRGANTVAADVRAVRVAQDGVLTDGLIGSSEQYNPRTLELADRLVSAESDGLPLWRGLSGIQLISTVEAFEMLSGRHGAATPTSLRSAPEADIDS